MISYAFILAILSTVGYGGGIPSDWKPGVEQGSLLWSETDPDPGLWPRIANGNLGFEVTRGVSYPMGYMMLQGVFNGHLNGTASIPPSHRAYIPSPMLFWLAPGKDVEVVGAVLDLERSMFRNRTRVGSCVWEQRFLAHALHLDLLVFHLALVAGDAGCTVELWYNWDDFGGGGPDFSGNTTRHLNANTSLFSAHSLTPEIPSEETREIAVAFDDVWGSGGSGEMVGDGFLRLAVAQSDLGDGGGGGDGDGDGGGDGDGDGVAGSVSERALKALEKYRQVGWGTLHEAHVGVWRELWSEGGVEVEGNGTVAASVNASLWALLANTVNSKFSTSPGGVGSDAYHGHTFWDAEFHVMPGLTVLYPSVVEDMLEYRLQRVDSAEERARGYGFSGAMFPWESAFTGLDTVQPPNIEGIFEQHVNGDIALAVRRLWYAQKNATTLQRYWPLLNGTCTFWLCRMQQTDVNPSSPPLPGFGSACAPQHQTEGSASAMGNWTIKKVQPPDESAGAIDDSAYTNAIAAQTLAFCIEATSILHLSSDARWKPRAVAPFLPLNTSLYHGGPVHPEYSDFHSKQINQADVQLLQFPLQVEMPVDVAKNDLNFYDPLIPSNGMYTGDLAIAIAWLQLGSREAADASFQTAFEHMDYEHFYTWKERAGSYPGNTNFITGAGDYIMAFTAGWMGIRFNPNSLDFLNPQLPAMGVTALKLRGLHYADTISRVSLNSTSICFQRLEDKFTTTTLILTDANHSNHTLSPLHSVCVSPGPKLSLTTTTAT